MTHNSDAEELAAEIVEAEIADNYFLSSMLRPRLWAANRDRPAGHKWIRPTQHWYFIRWPDGRNP
ncbi:MAG: hypothetical protein ACRYG8_44140 [Janthinobacterium lividum]